MSILSLFRKKPASANIARERLQVIIAHERMARRAPNLNLAALKKELIAVLAKYARVRENQIALNVEQDRDCAVLELNVTLPKAA